MYELLSRGLEGLSSGSPGVEMERGRPGLKESSDSRWLLSLGSPVWEGETACQGGTGSEANASTVSSTQLSHICDWEDPWGGGQYPLWKWPLFGRTLKISDAYN